MGPLQDLSSNLQGSKGRCRWDVVGCFLLSGKCHMSYIKKYEVYRADTVMEGSQAPENHMGDSPLTDTLQNICSWRTAGQLCPLGHSMFSPAISRCGTAPTYLPSRPEHMIAFQRTVLKSICFSQGFLMPLWLPSFSLLVPPQLDFLI